MEDLYLKHRDRDKSFTLENIWLYLKKFYKEYTESGKPPIPRDTWYKVISVCNKVVCEAILTHNFIYIPNFGKIGCRRIPRTKKRFELLDMDVERTKKYREEHPEDNKAVIKNLNTPKHRYRTFWYDREIKKTLLKYSSHSKLAQGLKKMSYDNENKITL